MKAKLSLSGLSPAALLAVGRNVVAKMTGNPAFPNPVPSLAEVSTACDNLEAAIIDASDGGKSKVAVRRQRVAELVNLLRRLALWVENVANGNASLILSAGMDVKRASSPVGTPPVPTGLRCSLPGSNGLVQLSWDAVKEAYTYEVQYCQGEKPSEDAFTKLVTITRSSYLVERLVSGLQYWFRVSATGTAGTSGWSDPARAYAP